MSKNYEKLVRLKHTCTELNADEIAELDREVPHMDLPFLVEEPTFYERVIPFDLGQFSQQIVNKHINYNKEKDKDSV